jgi:hypothetical protein
MSLYANILWDASDEIDQDYITSWHNVPLIWKVITVFIPICNTFLSILAIVAIFRIVHYYLRRTYLYFGYFITKWFISNPKHFIIKEFIIRKCFPFYLDPFYNYFESRMIHKLYDYALKILLNEKSKQQSEQKAHPEPDRENQETSIKG